MADHQYLSIGEVLGLLLEDFPDVTISKIRFLESQGLIEPERTPSGYRKFYDNDVELLRAILHEQKANFLPLKVIRDRIESGAIDADSTGGRTPPRGIRNVEQREQSGQPDIQPNDAETRDSVFRRTDGGPEWAGGHALIPGAPESGLLGLPVDGSNSPITTAVAVIPSAPSMTATKAGGESDKQGPTTVSADPKPEVQPDPKRRAERRAAAGTVVASLIEPLPRSDIPATAVAPSVETLQPSTAGFETPPSRVQRHEPSESVAAGSTAAGSPHGTAATDPTSPPRKPGSPAAAAALSSPALPSADATAASTLGGDSDRSRELPYNSDELCAAALITAAQLAALQDYGIITSRGSGVDTSFHPAAVEIARIAGQLLGQGIDSRHLRAWRQAAERESALFEQRIMPLLRQRNPQARQAALNSLSELSGLGARLHDALVNSLLQHHFDGT